MKTNLDGYPFVHDEEYYRRRLKEFYDDGDDDEDDSSPVVLVLAIIIYLVSGLFCFAPLITDREIGGWTLIVMIFHLTIGAFAVAAGLLSLIRLAGRVARCLKNKTFRQTYKFRN